MQKQLNLERFNMKEPEEQNRVPITNFGNRGYSSHCQICGKELTNPISIGRGIGPVCYARENMQFLLDLTVILDQGAENNEGEDTFPTIRDYEQHITKWDCKCGASLKGESIEHYKHEGGWELHRFHEKQWLYLKCRKCGTCWSLWKLGVPASIESSIARAEEHSKATSLSCFGTEKVKNVFACRICDFYSDCMKEEKKRKMEKLERI